MRTLGDFLPEHATRSTHQEVVSAHQLAEEHLHKYDYTICQHQRHAHVGDGVDQADGLTFEGLASSNLVLLQHGRGTPAIFVKEALLV